MANLDLPLAVVIGGDKQVRMRIPQEYMSDATIGRSTYTKPMEARQLELIFLSAAHALREMGQELPDLNRAALSTASGTYVTMPPPTPPGARRVRLEDVEPADAAPQGERARFAAFMLEIAATLEVKDEHYDHVIGQCLREAVEKITKG